MTLALVIIAFVFMYALIGAYVGTKNKLLWEARHHETARHDRHHYSYECGHGVMMVVGYPLWPLAYPCSLVFCHVESREALGATHAERKQQKKTLKAQHDHDEKMLEAKRDRELREFEFETRKHSLDQADEITELLRKSNEGNPLTL